jgi:hypothetical protein
MFTIMLCVLFGCATGVVLGVSGAASVGWSVAWGVLAALAFQVGAGLFLRRKVKAAMDRVQGVLQAGQKRLQQKVSQWQMRPPGSIKQAQIELEREQRAFVEQALEKSRDLEVFYRWTPMLRRQVDTLRMQLYYQSKDYKKVDALLPTCLFLDPLTAAMKLARMHVTGAAGADKFFEKQVKRLRYGQGGILYALYAWMQVERGDLAGAHKVLVRACAKVENETLKRNREHLANNRPAHFSNAGLGEEWYALGLEEPKVKMQRQRNVPGRPF